MRLSVSLWQHLRRAPNLINIVEFSPSSARLWSEFCVSLSSVLFLQEALALHLDAACLSRRDAGHAQVVAAVE